MSRRNKPGQWYRERSYSEVACGAWTLATRQSGQGWLPFVLWQGFAVWAVGGDEPLPASQSAAEQMAIRAATMLHAEIGEALKKIREDAP